MTKTTRDITKSRKPRAEKPGEPVLVRIQPPMAKRIDQWRGQQEDIPGRPEAIRRLVEFALGKMAKAPKENSSARKA